MALYWIYALILTKVQCCFELAIVNSTYHVFGTSSGSPIMLDAHCFCRYTVTFQYYPYQHVATPSHHL
jgi:hypothetical protein